jgi:hypothetical protein
MEKEDGQCQFGIKKTRTKKTLFVSFVKIYVNYFHNKNKHFSPPFVKWFDACITFTLVLLMKLIQTFEQYLSSFYQKILWWIHR